MAFEGLSQKLQNIFSKLSGRGRLNEKDVQDAMREVKLALLEADVNFGVVRDFIKKVSQRAVGQEILSSLSPAQQVIKIVNEELTTLMGAQNSKLTVASNPPTVIMLVGLQGAGKTSMVGKLALWLKKNGKKPLLAACDIYRPAAIKQLQVVAEQVGAPVIERGTQDPVKTATEAYNHARLKGYDTLIIDTAGRLHIDTELMQELSALKANIKPHEILLVVDAMTGQDAVNVAHAFDEQLGLDGVILTKLDGDTRGGAALSVKAVTGKPIKFAGVGEKVTDLEPFYPDRMASRILGMGDVLSLIERAQETVDEQQAKELENKLRKNKFDLEDFLTQLRQLKKMGPLADILGMLPGVNKQAIEDNADESEKNLKRVEAIICAMTPAERRNPDLLNASRRKRIASGSGTSVQEINRLMKQFDSMKSMMKGMNGKMGMKGLGRGGGFPF